MGGSLTRSLLTKLSGASSSRAAIVNGVSMMVLLPYMGIISQTPKVAIGIKPLRSNMLTTLQALQKKITNAHLAPTPTPTRKTHSPTTPISLSLFLTLCTIALHYLATAL